MADVASFFEDIEYGDPKPAVKVMIKNDHAKEIRIVFRKGQEMKEHKAPFPIVVQVLRGEIDFGVLGERHLLKEGMAIALESSVPHDLIAHEDSIVRLSLNIKDSEERVKSV